MGISEIRSAPPEATVRLPGSERARVALSEREAPQNAARPETHSDAQEQIIRAGILEDNLAHALLSEYLQAGDVKAANELVKRANVERDMRDLSTKELARIRDRKDADISLAATLEQELGGMQKDGSDENKDAWATKQAESIEPRIMRSEVTKIALTGGAPEDHTEGVFKPQDGEPHIFDNGKDIGTLTNHTPRGHLREWLAGFVAKAVGAERVVPPTVIRAVEGRVGSVQQWVKGDVVVAHLDWAQKIQPADMEAIALMDYLLNNTDRHTSNFLVDDTGRAFAIDHGAILSLKKGDDTVRSFPLRAVKGRPLSPEMSARMQSMMSSDARMKALEQAFSFVLSEDASRMFGEFKKRAEELARTQQFPEYRLPFASDEAHFTSHEDTGDTAAVVPQTEIRPQSTTPETFIPPIKRQAA